MTSTRQESVKENFLLRLQLSHVCRDFVKNSILHFFLSCEGLEKNVLLQIFTQIVEMLNKVSQEHKKVQKRIAKKNLQTRQDCCKQCKEFLQFLDSVEQGMLVDFMLGWTEIRWTCHAGQSEQTEKIDSLQTWYSVCSNTCKRRLI